MTNGIEELKFYFYEFYLIKTVLIASGYCVSTTLRSLGQHPWRDAGTMFSKDQSGNRVMRGAKERPDTSGREM